MINSKVKIHIEGVGEKFSLYAVIILILLIVYTVLLLIPLIWAMYTSLKPADEFWDNILLPSSSPTLVNYSNALRLFYLRDPFNNVRQIYMGEMFLYSIVYSFGSALVATLSPCIMGYLTAKYPNKFSKAVTGMVIVCMILPIVGSLPSEVQVAKALGIYNNLIASLVLKGHFLSMYFLVFQSIFKGIPNAFAEAAKIDGASHFRVFVLIMLPLVKTTFFTVLLIRFIEFWNDYQTPLIYLPSFPTVARGLFAFNLSTANEIASVPGKLAGAMVMLLPILVVFVLFHKRLMGNLTMGGLKG